MGIGAVISRGRFNDNPAMHKQTVNHTPRRWWLRWVTFALAALAAASATVWGLKLSAQGGAVQTSGPVAALALSDPQAMARALGGGMAGAAAPGAPEAAPLSKRFKLVGVVAGPAPKGYALIAVDGKPAQPFRVGAVLEDGLMLQSVAPRSAALAASREAPALVTLELPKISPAL